VRGRVEAVEGVGEEAVEEVKEGWMRFPAGLRRCSIVCDVRVASS
jgi:hypothetical protein